MSPDGDRSRIFKLLYFADKAPDEVRRHWDILVGRQPASGFVLRMHDRDIGTADGLGRGNGGSADWAVHLL